MLIWRRTIDAVSRLVSGSILKRNFKPKPRRIRQTLSFETQTQIRAALLDTYFKHCNVESASEAVLRDLHDHTSGRFDVCRFWLIPWIKRYAEFGLINVLEVGCGTGSTTAALALEATHVDVYDIAGPSIEAARRRLQIMNLSNVSFHEHEPENILGEMQRLHPQNSVDCIVIFAVLEHQLYHERLATLKVCWNLLRPGGILVVGDTPNRLCFYDFHTSYLPFFNMLPAEVAIDYVSRSPRREICDAIKRASSDGDARETLARLGTGVSYHEFELALGSVTDLIVGDGFDPEPLSYYGLSLETRLLYTYFRHKNFQIHPAFCRDTIDVILRKPDKNIPTAKTESRNLDAIVRPLSLKASIFGRRTKSTAGTRAKR
jgi:S-adenosylmethionine-dependent methyltransferase